MKKLTTLCLIIVSLTVSAKSVDCNTIDFGNNLSSNFNDVVGNSTNPMDDTTFEIEKEEQDAPFDFDTKKYLPENFNPYEEVSILEDYAMLNAEEDEKLDFDTKQYLPTGFDAYSENELIMEDYELLRAAPDAPFDFNTVDYLPVNFNS